MIYLTLNQITTAKAFAYAHRNKMKNPNDRRSEKDIIQDTFIGQLAELTFHTENKDLISITLPNQDEAESDKRGYDLGDFIQTSNLAETYRIGIKGIDSMHKNLFIPEEIDDKVYILYYINEKLGTCQCLGALLITPEIRKGLKESRGLTKDAGYSKYKVLLSELDKDVTNILLKLQNDEKN